MLSVLAPQLWERMQLLLDENTEIQKNCRHVFKISMRFDADYVGREGEVGADVVSHRHCTVCNLNEPFEKFPESFCWLCTGKMKRADQALQNEYDAPVYVCEACGHVYVMR